MKSNKRKLYGAMPLAIIILCIGGLNCYYGNVWMGGFVILFSIVWVAVRVYHVAREEEKPWRRAVNVRVVDADGGHGE